MSSSSGAELTPSGQVRLRRGRVMRNELDVTILPVKHAWPELRRRHWFTVQFM
jgi:hypothetical protein